MARGLVKYNQVMISRILELASKGYSDCDIAKLLGITRSTLYRWKKRDNRLSDNIEKMRSEGINSIINSGLIALAQGVELKETIKETIEFDENNNPIRIKEKVTKHPPKEKAIEILARRYAPELAISDKRESTTNIINIDSMSHKELLEYRKANNVLDAEYKEVATDIPRDDKGTYILEASEDSKSLESGEAPLETEE
jgi:predicted transcriptional regulator